MEGRKIREIAIMRKDRPTGYGLFLEDLGIEANSLKQQEDDSYIKTILKESYNKWHLLSADERARYREDASVLEAVYAESGYICPIELLNSFGMDERGERVLSAGNPNEDEPPAIWIKILRGVFKEKERLASREPKDEALKPGEAVIARLRKKKPSAFGLFIEGLIKEADSQGQQTDSSFLDQIMLESRDQWLSLSPSEKDRYSEEASAAMDESGEAVVAGKAGNLNKCEPLDLHYQILPELSEKKKGFTLEEPKAEALKPRESVSARNLKMFLELRSQLHSQLEEFFTSEEPKAEA